MVANLASSIDLDLTLVLAVVVGTICTYIIVPTTNGWVIFTATG